MADISIAGVNVKDFGAAGDGITDDTAAILNAVNAAADILFPEGTYSIRQNLILPAGKRLVLLNGAKFSLPAGVTITVNSDIHAGLYPIFTGAGRVVTGLSTQTAYPQWFGASGLTGAGGRGIVATGSIAAGSNLLTLDGGFDRFKDGQTVIVMHAGKTAAIAAPPAPGISLTTLWNGTITTGSTAFGYRIAEMTADGAVSLPSPVARLTNGPDNPDAFEYWMGTRVTLTLPAASPAAQGWAVYGEMTNPEGHRGLLAVQWKRQPEWHDVRNGPIDRSVPPWVPVVLPDQPMDNNLIATVVSGGGTGRLTLSLQAGATVSSAAVMADDAPALQRAYDYLASGGGGTLELREGRFYMHSPTSGDKKIAVYFTSNVVTCSPDRSILQSYPNFLVDGQVTMSGKASSVHNWGFEGVVFDGGNEVNTTEFYNWIFGTMPDQQGNASYTNFTIRDCEFRYIVGKALVTGVGRCENYRIENNYIHHCNSNAMSVGGKSYYVNGNVCEYCLAATPAYIGGAESIILTESFQAHITNNTIRRWGNISAGNAFKYESIEVSGNRFEDQNGIGFGGYCKNISIINNQLTLTNTNHISGNGINWELSQGTGRYAYDIHISGNVIDCTGNLGAIAFNVSSANTLSRLTVSGNTIIHRNTTFETVQIQNASDVIFTGNRIMTENTASDMGVIATGGSHWVITGNRVSRKNIQVPDNSVCSGNHAGGLRAGAGSVITGNKLDGAQGPNTWGGLLNLAGSYNIVTNNEIDLSQTALTLAIAENGASSNNTIKGNRVINYGTRDSQNLIRHNFGSTVLFNSPYNAKWIESDRIPEQGVWSVGDRAFNNRPVPASGYEGWICTIAGTAVKNVWAPNTSYEPGSLVSSNGKVYRSVGASGGKSGTTAPSHIAGTAVDGTVTWEYVDIAAVFKPFGAIVFGTVDQTAPAVPSGLAASTASMQVTLAWNPNAEPDLAGYNLYQNSKKINTSLLRTVTYTVTGLTNGTTYSFQVSAVDVSGNESSRSTAVSAVPRDTVPPAAPTGLSVTTGVNRLSLTWTANTEADLLGYYVYRNGVKINSTPLTAAAYTDTGLTNGTSYRYEVTAIDRDGNESAKSASVFGTPGDNIPPAAPAGLSAVPGNGQTDLAWTANKETDMAGYNVYRDGVKVNAALVTGTAYRDTGLTNERTYSYTVTAVDTSGNESAPSSPVRVMPSEYRRVIVSDSFNRANSLTSLGTAETGQVWVSYQGQMGVRANMAESFAPNANVSIVESGVSNCAVIGNVASKGNPAWIVFRAKNNQNYFLVSLRKDSYNTFEKVENNKRVFLGSAFPGAVYADGAEIKIILKDSKIDLYYNGVLTRTYTDTFNQLETKHGVGGSYTDTYVDRFTVLG